MLVIGKSKIYLPLTARVKARGRSLPKESTHRKLYTLSAQFLQPLLPKCAIISPDHPD